MANEVRVAREPLEAFAREIFIKLGMPPEDAEAEVSELIWANLRGVDSHGVLLIPIYREWIEKGVMNPKPNIQVLKETPATIFVEADRALGPVVTVFTVKKALEKAKKVGVCWAAIRNTTHQGAMGYYTQMAAEQDMAGLIWVCNPPNMAPFGAKAAGIHNSPIAITVPAKRHQPLILDMATSVAAAGKITLALDKGIPIPQGWAIDREGKPTTDPKEASILLPFGGPKGSGLSMMFECLSSVMMGNPMLGPALFGRQPGLPLKKKEEKAVSVSPGHSRIPHIQNSVFIAVDISQFTDVAQFKKDIDEMIDGIKALPRADGCAEILVPGEPEYRTYLDRSRNGIPLPVRTVQNLRDVAGKLGVEVPPELKAA